MFSSVLHSVVSDSWRPHGLQHDRLPCPSPAPGVCSNSCPLSQWCHPTISSSVVPFSSHLQSFPASEYFSSESILLIRWLKYWSFSFSIIPSSEYSGLILFKIDWFDLLAVHGTLKSLLQHHSLQAPVLWLSAFFIVRLSHRYMTTGKTIALTIWTFVGKVISLLFHTLSRLVTILTLSKLPSQPGYQPSQPPYLIIAPYLNGLNWVEDSSSSGWLTLKLFLEVKFIPREDTLANHSGCRV